jgi:hypothetical protein
VTFVNDVDYLVRSVKITFLTYSLAIEQMRKIYRLG